VTAERSMTTKAERAKRDASKKRRLQRRRRTVKEVGHFPGAHMAHTTQPGPEEQLCRAVGEIQRLNGKLEVTRVPSGGAVSVKLSAVIAGIDVSLRDDSKPEDFLSTFDRLTSAAASILSAHDIPF
jgi:hypothetical protein